MKMSSGVNPHNILVQEDLNTLSSQLKLFHNNNRILPTRVQELAVEDEHHKRDKKRAAGDAMNDGPAVKKHSNSPPSAEVQEHEGTKADCEGR